MNDLAHLYLAGDDPESLIGSLMGDFAKGRIDEKLAPGIRWGITVHRTVDVFTDANVIVGRSKRRIRPEFRRYAGILVDLYYDHFLATQWAHYSDVCLATFSQKIYWILEGHRKQLPPRMQRSMSYMVDNDVLQSYLEIDGIRRALIGIEGRLKRESRLREAVYDLERNYRLLKADFAAFFPELIGYVRGLKSADNEEKA